jgi:hypothetical protein
MKNLVIGFILGAVLSSATVGIACGMWKLTIEDDVYVGNGKMVRVTCSAWVHGEYLATTKSCTTDAY